MRLTDGKTSNFLVNLFINFKFNYYEEVTFGANAPSWFDGI